MQRTVDIILFDEQVKKVKESTSDIIEIELREDQVLDVVHGVDLDLVMDSLKTHPTELDNQIIESFIDAFGANSILEHLDGDEIEDEVNDRILNGEINSEELNDSDNTKIFITENLEDVELWESFLNAVQRCKPRDLITLLDNAK